MPVHNADIAAIFEEIADLLEIQGENPFRIRAYRNAARQVEGMGVALADMLARDDDLTALPGIGTDLAAKIREIVETGSCKALDKLRKKLPPSIIELLKIPGLGPKRVRALHDQLKVRSVEQLAKAAKSGRIRELEGFGPKTERVVLEALAAHVTGQRRFALAAVAPYAEPLRDYLAGIPGVEQAVIAGSYRRCKETVGDLDLLVTAADSKTIMERFVAYDQVSKVIAKGDTRSTVILKAGLQVDLRVVDPGSYGAALHYFTGSKAHNVAIRRLGQQNKLKINEYGVFRGERRIGGDTEESVFHSVGLPWIAPELREDRGEIEAARKHRLPALIESGDLKGDLHVHSQAGAGHASLKELVEAARARGLAYIAITTAHRLAASHGAYPKSLPRWLEDIDKLNAALQDFTVLKAVDVDILEDGSLDLADELLAEFDLVIGAVRAGLKLPRARQTKRIMKAMEHPRFSILAHPSGLPVEGREPYDVDLLKLARHAHTCGCCLELNAHPARLDLLDTHIRMAKDAGARFAIGSDAHGARDFQNLDYAVGQARRGWLEPGDVVNTLALRELWGSFRKARTIPI